MDIGAGSNNDDGTEQPDAVLREKLQQQTALAETKTRALEAMQAQMAGVQTRNLLPTICPSISVTFSKI